VVWGSTFLLLVAITPRVDVTLAYYLFLAHYPLLKALDDRESQPWFFLSAALLGLAFGIKYSALLYVLALSPLIAWVAYSRFRGLAASSRALFIFGMLAVGTALPWLTKNWLLHHAPLYPYFTVREIEPWLAHWYAGQSMALRADEVIQGWHRQISIPFNLWDLVLAPGRLAVEEEAASYSLNLIFLSLPLWPFLARNATLNWLMIPTLCYVIGLIAYYPANNLRYLMPAVAPFTIVAAHTVETLKLQLFSARRGSWFSAFAIAVALLPSAKTMALNYLTGTSSWESYLRMNPIPRGNQAYSDIALYVNQHLPRDSRVLMIFDARGYYFTVPVIQDNAHTNWLLLARTEAVPGCLRSTGISHVLVNIGALYYYTGRGLDPRFLQWEAFREFAERCLTQVHEGHGFILYRVRE